MAAGPCGRPGRVGGTAVGRERYVLRALARRRERQRRRPVTVRSHAQGAQRACAGVGRRGHEGDEDVAGGCCERPDREGPGRARRQPDGRPEGAAGRPRRRHERAADAVGLRPDGYGMAVGRERELRRAREAAGRRERVAAPNAIAPGACVAAKIAPQLGQTATRVPSGRAATSLSNAAPAGRRVETSGRRSSMVLV